MSVADRIASAVTEHSAVVIAVVLLLTVALGVGMGNIEQSSSLDQFQSETTEAEKFEYIQDHFRTGPENTTTVQVIVRDDNVLDKESLVAQLQTVQRLQENATIGPTLAGQPTGVASLVAQARLRSQPGGPSGPATVEQQIGALQAMNQSEIDAILAQRLGDSGNGGNRAIRLMPTSYQTGSTEADATMLVVTQTTDEAIAAGGSAGDRIVESQTAMQSIVHEAHGTDSAVFGSGVITDEINRSMTDSLLIVGPLALVFVLFVLIVAYRDLLDILLGLTGIGLVLVWTFGFMGWLGYAFNQLFVAIPVLLIGLAIDYAIHVFMRHREERSRSDGEGTGASMRVALASVGVALFFVTATTVIGFLSNLISDVPPIRQFGIVAAFIVFGLLFPALKLEVDRLRQRFGRNTTRSPFGRGERVGRLLTLGPELARRAPYVVVAVAVVLAAGGGVAATGIDTTLDQTAFLPEDSPEWMNLLPAAIQPGDYGIKEHAEYLNEKFVQSRGNAKVEFLIRGPVTDPETLDTIVNAREALRDTESAAVRADGALQLTGPVETISAVAAENETVAGMVEDADTDGDGVPDRNLDEIYDAVYDANPEAASATIHREDGEYRSLRLSVALAGTTNTRTITAEMRAVATGLEAESNLDVIATGSPIITELVQRSLLRTLVEGFLITFAVILAFLAIIFRVRYGSAILGAVVLFPVVLAQAWLFGTMYLAGLAFTTESAIIAAIGIGIGVDYAIHIGERFMEERARGREPIEALSRTVRGTGGALLASAATTVAGFGVLMLALVPSLQRFGFITGVAITFAFLGSVLVLPSLLVLYVRFGGDPVSRTESTPATANK